MELATNLACVALYDIVIYADDSGSMIFEEGGERVNDLKLILGRVAEVIAGSRLSPYVACNSTTFSLLRSTTRLSIQWGADCCGATRGAVACSITVPLPRVGWYDTRGGPQVATLFDSDGIMVRFMKSSTEGNGIRDAAAVNTLMQQARDSPYMAANQHHYMAARSTSLHDARSSPTTAFVWLLQI